ncbi:DMT family transporter [Methylobacterium sp.]|jgi:drug/metabolite transporter (DMT)-like permease|uniref:DMT family transporter n=1 Tax=Methylobacterium sp. TaxID=409 RepID=UPI002630DE05|nr:DMT family transporter [Methylobacterium sp.]MDB5646720.1 EamA family transporter [Methylobacterium sp.]
MRVPQTPTGRAPEPAAAAYPLLVFTMLLWGGNVVASKWAAGEVSPQVLTCLRWAFACLALALPARAGLVAEWDRLRRHWRYVLLMGACGYTLYASLFYAAGLFTSGINIALFQGAIPVLVILINYVVHRVAVTGAQILGVAVTLAGAVVAASHGDWRVLAHFAFNRGDVLMLAACALYAGYTVALSARPKVSGLSFFTAVAVSALLTSLPPLAAEWTLGHTIWPTPKGWAIVLFVALGPSLVAQLAFMRGVELIGPNRAGLFVNLVPIFGAGLAILLVGEPFRWHDALALALVVGGIAIAERLGRRAVP